MSEGVAMARAPRICSQPGCPAQAANRGRCQQHQPKQVNPTPWARSKPVPRVTARWRKLVLQRDGWRCRKCGEPATEADHIISRAVAPDLVNDPDNGQALCARCHQAKTLAEAAAGRARATRSK